MAFQNIENYPFSYTMTYRDPAVEQLNLGRLYDAPEASLCPPVTNETNHSGCHFSNSRPETSRSRKTIIDKSYLEMPVTEDDLNVMELPLSLLSEPNLRVHHIETLVWLDALKLNVHAIVENENTWIQYCKSLRSLGLNSYQRVVPDADIERLKRLNIEMINFGKHLIPDLDIIVNTVRALHRSEGVN